MKADFSGWATKAGLKCSDGRTIMPDAFKHQDQMQVPLVYMHGHSDVENILGHALLTNRDEGVWADCFFNKSAKAAHAKEAVHNKDITMLSIWANELIERAGRVLHGAIREVSLVLSGANPGAKIEQVTLQHADGEEFTLDDEVIIYTGELFHSNDGVPEGDNADGNDDNADGNDDENDPTVEDVYNTMNDEQKEVLHFMLGEALNGASEGTVSHAAADDPNATIQDVYDSMTDVQKQVLHFMIGEALANADTSMQQGNTNSNDNNQEGTTMTNVFETGKNAKTVLSHDDMKGIVADAQKIGSLKDAVDNYALAHGITDIDVLFPEARTISDMPEFFKRRTEWVNTLLSACRKSPFTRIKTISADLTFEDARAKGYIKGNLKKEEFFGVTKRVTIPATIYKKQKLDRDDMVDITDFDVVAWLKAEMRIMLDEELARAVLIGDGRDVSHEDKINEGNIRPIASDHELYTTTVTVNIGDANSSAQEIIDALIKNRRYLRGTGLPTMFTTETYIAMFLLLKDTTGRRIYQSLDELANELRVTAIVPVEVMEDEPDIVAVIVNPVDYILGADKGGEVNTFDDFDIDYNQYKYLIETRVSGALVKLKSALVIRKSGAADVLVAPNAPTFVSGTGVVTIVATTGVVYKNADTDATLSTGAQTALAPGATLNVHAEPASGYYFATSNDDDWSFTRPS